MARDELTMDIMMNTNKRLEWEKSILALPPGDQLEELKVLSRSNVGGALWLVANGKFDSHTLIEIIDIALLSSNASTIGEWLKAIEPRLGYRKLLQTLEAKLGVHEIQVEWAVYWLPRVVPDGVSWPIGLAKLRGNLQDEE
jgi:hypothetical protein